MLTAIATRYLHRVIIQSKALDFDGMPLETIEINHPTDGCDLHMIPSRLWKILA